VDRKQATVVTTGKVLARAQKISRMNNPAITRFHWLKNCKKLPFSEPKQLIEAETRFG
jgi:hypothetical protein